MRRFTLSGPGWGRVLLPIGGLLLLCLIWAIRWVRADFQPGISATWTVSPLMMQAALLGLFAAGVSVAAVVRGANWPGRDLAGRAALVGIGLFVVPAVLTSFAKDQIGD